MLKKLQHFLQQEIDFLLGTRVLVTPDLIEKLIVSSIGRFNFKLSPEETSNLKQELIAQLPPLNEIPEEEEEECYHPPYVIKEKTPINATEQVLNKAQQTLDQIRQLLFDEYINIKLISTMSREQISTYIKPIMTRCLTQQKLYLNSIEQQVLETLFLDDMVGSGPLEPLLADQSVTDILVNAPDKIYVERNGYLEKASTRFKNQDHILHIIHQILARSGRRLDMTHPYVNIKLYDGTRINAIIPPVALDSPTLSIRKFSEKPIYLEDMVRQGNLSAEMMVFLIIAVQSRLNIIVSGGTGSGKTTLLNGLAHMIKDTERIITIEDVAELRLNKEHVVRLETRNVSLEGAGAVSEQDLLINALRMRPDRIVLGEVRGKEVFDMLQAMNTGHDGSMSTIHANGAEEVPLRLIDMLSMANTGISTQSSLKQIKTAIDLIVHTSRLLDGKRRVVQISEVIEVHENEIKLQPLFSFDYRVAEKNKITGNFTRHVATPRCLKKAQHFGLDHIINLLFEEHHEE